MPTVNVRGCEFYYELHGSGQPLVLISGYVADHSYWMSILSELSERYQVLVFDNRATGLSIDGATFPLTIESMADDTVALISALGLVKPAIVGQSMGGAIVQSVAARYSDFISRAVILNSTSKWRLSAVHGLRAMHLSYRDGASFDSLFEANLAWVFGEAFLKDPSRLESLRVAMLSNPNPQSKENQARQFAALEAFDGRLLLDRIRVPVLIGFGPEDIISPPGDSLQLARGILGAKLVEFKGTAHGIIREAPAELLRELLEFVVIESSASAGAAEASSTSATAAVARDTGLILPFEAIKIGSNTATVFARLPSPMPQRLDITSLRASVADWDRDAAFSYPEGLTASSFSDLAIGDVAASSYKFSGASGAASIPTVLLIHGGGFVCELANVHKSLMANIIARTPCHAILPHYSLAPEFKAPRSIMEITETLRLLLADPERYGFTENVVVIGYSSGGNLAWNAVLNLLNNSSTRGLIGKISNLILMSPWVDVSMTTTKSTSYQSQQDTDKMAQTWGLEQMRDWYLPEGATGREPIFSPIYRAGKDMEGMPRTTIIVGEIDRLLGDSISAAKVLSEAGVGVELAILEGQSHNHSAHAGLRDGVFTPDIIARVMRGESVGTVERARDGLGIISCRFSRDFAAPKL